MEKIPLLCYTANRSVSSSSPKGGSIMNAGTTDPRAASRRLVGGVAGRRRGAVSAQNQTNPKKLRCFSLLGFRDVCA
jgi:hypothetical protein